VADAAFEMHPVAAQTVVHRHVPRVVLLVQEDAPIGGAVRAGLPRGVLLAVAAVASAAGITVLGVPVRAFTSHAKPTHQRHRMQERRPLYGAVFRSIGISNGCSPRRRAAGSRIWCSLPGGSGGMGRGRLRGALKMLFASSPETPISHSAFS